MAGWDRVVRMAAVAALGFALSACGGGDGSSSAGAAAAQASTTGQSAASADGSTSNQSTSTGTATQPPAGSGGSGTSGSSTSGSGSGSGTSSPPTASTGNVTINWNPPTQNTNGTPLTNLAGFKIHYGTASQKYTQTITVSNPGLVTYVIANLSPGTYYLAVTAYSSAGTESPLSSEVSTTVN